MLSLWELWCQSPTLFTVGQHRRSGGRWSVRNRASRVLALSFVSFGASRWLQRGDLARRILFGPLHPSIVRGALHRVSRAAGNVYFEQIRVLKAGVPNA